MFGLGHIDFAPILYGVVIFFGIWSMWSKLKHGYIFSFIGEVFVFWLVFALHGGTMGGGFAATVASLIAGATIFRPRRG